jgi:hypothetical protein
MILSDQIVNTCHKYSRIHTDIHIDARAHSCACTQMHIDAHAHNNTHNTVKRNEKTYIVEILFVAGFEFLQVEGALYVCVVCVRVGMCAVHVLRGSVCMVRVMLWGEGGVDKSPERGGERGVTGERGMREEYLLLGVKALEKVLDSLFVCEVCVCVTRDAPCAVCWYVGRV